MEKYGIKDEGENHEIEDYWQKVIINSRYFTITEKDKAILKYIKKVNMVKFPENVNNFRVDFIFQQNEFFTPEVSMSYIFKKLINSASDFIETSIKKAVITVPAYFDYKQRSATEESAKLAGIEVLGIINEPTAATYEIDHDLTNSQNEKN